MSGTVLVCAETLKLSVPYVAALEAVGIARQRIRVTAPEDPPADAAGEAARAAGLILCGGPDVHPSRYGEEPLDGAGLELFPEMDELEHALLAGARRAAVPVWALCRGMQALNVALGGSLWQDLRLQVPGATGHRPGGPVDRLVHALDRIDRETSFGSALSTDGGRPAVNSRHHQAVKELAPGLRAVAWAPDGVLEALEGTGDWWLRGVQWHPENLLALPLQRALWVEFVTACERPRTTAAPTSAGGTR